MFQEKYRQEIDDILAAAKGFVDTGEQDRYDECENAITQALREIRLLASQWKVGLLFVMSPPISLISSVWIIF